MTTAPEQSDAELPTGRVDSGGVHGWKTVSVRSVVLVLGLAQCSCAEWRERRAYEKKRSSYAREGIILPYQAPLPPVPVF